ncbi:MAG: class I adenylate-forming enzyme family protein [Actinomycetota bacterium]
MEDPLSALGSLPWIVREAARRFGDQSALVAPDGERVSYRELDRRSEAVTAGLLRRGVGSGQVVALTMPSSPDYVVAYLAIAKAGAIACGVNPRLTPTERADALAVVDPALVLEDPAELEPVDEPLPALEPDPDRPVVIVLTSGTTGAPLGALFCERQIAAIAEMEAGREWGGGGPTLAGTEFAHIGFMTKLPWNLRKGTRIHTVRRWRAAEALEILSRERIPQVGGIAAQIALMLREPSFDSHDWSHVRMVVAGGGPSWPSLVREARERFGAPYSVRYSCTESGGLGCMTSPHADDEEVCFTVGKPRTGIDLDIRDGEGRPLAQGEPGEVWLRSPAVMERYWRDPEATARALVDGWLRTGDVGAVDERGLLRLVGRSKEMFIRGGYNVYPTEVESVLTSHPAVADLAIVPRPDDVMGEIGVAVVVPRDPDHPPALEGLRSFGADRLAKHKLPEAVRIVDTIPLTSMHKIDRRRLAEEERAGARR